MTAKNETVDGNEYENENLVRAKTIKLEMDDGKLLMFAQYEDEESNLTNFKPLPITFGGLENNQELVLYRGEDGFEHAWRWEDLVDGYMGYSAETRDDFVSAEELLFAFGINPEKSIQYKHTEVCPSCDKFLSETTGEMPAKTVLYDYDDISKEEFERGILRPRGSKPLCVDCA